MADNYFHGYPMRWDGDQWRFEDTGMPTAGSRRPCGHCGREDTPEGHDGCLGTLPDVTNACCGHGRTDEAYVATKVGITVRGRNAMTFIEAAQAEGVRG